MRWVELPPYFTSLTETACDLANQTLREPLSPLAAHRLESVAATAPPSDALPPPPTPSAVRLLSDRDQTPTAYTDVYVDDFLLLAQTQHKQRQVLRAALHSIDAVFRPLTPDDPPTRKEPASVKKFLKGDASWLTFKRVLGWDINSQTMTIHFPPHRADRLREVLQWLRSPRERLSVTKWHQMLGELRSVSLALPGTRSLFSMLQHALSRSDQCRVRLTQRIYDVAADFLDLVNSVATRPTRLYELVPTAPAYIGACDASQRGTMGGVWLDVTGATPPILWRTPFAPHISTALVTSANRRGTLSISDFELTGMNATPMCSPDLATSVSVLYGAGDNSAAISWSQKGSATSVAARAYLLQFSALHQRRHRYLARYHHIPGPVNTMADDASRRWDFLDHELLSHFNSAYPQTQSWTLLPLANDTNSALTGALCRQRQRSASHVSIVQLPTCPTREVI